MSGLSNVKAIQNYFSVPNRPVTMTELRALTREDRIELADAIFAETGWERLSS